MRNPNMVLSLAGLALSLIFVIGTTESVDVEFLFWSIQTHRAVLLVLVLATGSGTGRISRGWRS